MTLQASYIKKTFRFSFDARTSRGPMKDKTSWFIKVWDKHAPDIFGIGECGPLPGLSVDHRPDFEENLSVTLDRLSNFTLKDIGTLHLNEVIPKGYSSIVFGLETALLDLTHGGQQIILDNGFRREIKIPINGLVWMGNFDFMREQIDEKISRGFTCVKLKVGGIDFDEECKLLDYVRKKYSREQITLRLDANGAFSAENVLQSLEKLSQFGIHSIEQPLKGGHSFTADVCRVSHIPIALDEELIGIETRDDKDQMLERLKPQFIVIKPTLHGGLSGANEWIELAQRRRIGWWITSALESNIGLNAICQLTANYPLTIPHGLGTGMIYERNIPSPLVVEQGTIFMDHKLGWDLSMINE